MDQHRKQIEAQVGRTKSWNKIAAEEKEAVIREKRDYTINQERLAENIWQMIWKGNMLIKNKTT